MSDMPSMDLKYHLKKMSLALQHCSVFCSVLYTISPPRVSECDVTSLLMLLGGFSQAIYMYIYSAQSTYNGSVSEGHVLK